MTTSCLEGTILSMKCPTCKQDKPTSAFYDKTETRKQSMCKSCFNTYCMERWTKRKLWAIEYKGGKCNKCNHKFHYSVYEFHHRDPSLKEAVWTKIRLWSEKRMKEELDKCDLLCANCHRITHHEHCDRSSAG